MAITPQHGLLTVDEYHALVEQGILSEDDRTELVNGKIVEMPPIGPLHQFNVDRLYELFLFTLHGRMMLRGQGPVRFALRLERQPDIALLRRYADNPKYYRSHLPTPADVLLLVEISDSTLGTDLGEKVQEYSTHDVIEYWVVDLQGDRVVVHREPTANGYADVRMLARGETISPLAFRDVVFTIDEILG